MTSKKYICSGVHVIYMSTPTLTAVKLVENGEKLSLPLTPLSAPEVGSIRKARKHCKREFLMP
jgi:hypothetical protein